MLFLTITCMEDATIHAEVKLKWIIMLWRERIEIITFTLFKLRPSSLEVQLLPSLHFLCKSGIFILCATPICSPKASAQHRFGRGGEVGVVLQGLAMLICFTSFIHFLPRDRVKVLEFWISLTQAGCLLFTSWKAVGAQAGALSAEIRAHQCTSTVVVKPSETQGSGIMAFRWIEVTVPESPVRWHW